MVVVVNDVEVDADAIAAVPVVIVEIDDTVVDDDDADSAALAEFERFVDDFDFVYDARRCIICCAQKHPT